MSVELLPVLMKMLLNFSPPTAYDRLAALRDTGDVEIEELAQESRKTVARAKEELLVMAEKERVDRQKEAIVARRRAAILNLGAPRTQATAEPVAAGRGDVGHRPDPRAGAQRGRQDRAHAPPPAADREPTPV